MCVLLCVHFAGLCAVCAGAERVPGACDWAGRVRAGVWRVCVLPGGALRPGARAFVQQSARNVHSAQHILQHGCSTGTFGLARVRGGRGAIGVRAGTGGGRAAARGAGVSAAGVGARTIVKLRN